MSNKNDNELIAKAIHAKGLVLLADIIRQSEQAYSMSGDRHQSVRLYKIKHAFKEHGIDINDPIKLRED